MIIATLPVIFDGQTSQFELNSPSTLLLIDRANLYGYANRSAGVVIKPAFQAGSGFSEGFAAVQQSGKWGYIDEKGAMVIPAMFLDVGPFSEGMAAVKVADNGDDSWKYIDKNGTITCAAGFERAKEFSDGYAVVMREGKSFFIDRKCSRAFPSSPDFEEADSFSEGLARVRIHGQNGYIDVNGELTIAPHFQAAGSFSEGLAPVSVSSERWGFIDKAGKMRISERFSSAQGFYGGLAAVSVSRGAYNNIYGFIDKLGNMVIAPQFESVKHFSEGLAAVAVIDPHDPVPVGAGAEPANQERWGYIDTKGEWILSPHFLSAGNFVSGVAPIVTAVSLKAYYIDTRGDQIIPISDVPQISSSLGLINENVWVRLTLSSSPTAATVYAIPLFEWENDKNLPNENEKLWMYQITDAPGVTPLVTNVPREAYIFVFKLNGQQRLVKRTIMEGHPESVGVAFR